jgi:hypothetical protein
MIQNRPLVILGSKEYVAEILSNLREGTSPSMIYLSDDSLSAAKAMQGWIAAAQDESEEIEQIYTHFPKRASAEYKL